MKLFIESSWWLDRTVGRKKKNQQILIAMPEIIHARSLGLAQFIA
jgi:hypothetical protein